MARQSYIITRAIIIALVAGWLSAAPALAQQSDDEGGLQANVGLHFDLNDNIYDSSSQEIESWIARISPDLLLSSTPGKRQFSAQYVGDYGKFLDSSDSADDYEDHSLTGRGLFQSGSRGLLDISAVFEQGHVSRGSGQTQGVPPDSPLFPPEPDEFERGEWTAQYTHGADGARGRLNFGVGGRGLEYSNNRTRTQFFDRDETYAFAGLAIGARERTAFVLQARYTDTEYDIDRPSGSLNGDNWRALVGFTWEATSKTEGSIRFGAQRRNFDDPGRETQTTASWDIDVRWSPREYSHFDFTTTRENQETVAGGNFIDRSSYGVSWTHEWTIGLESVLSWDRRDDDFVGSNREQDETETYFGLRLPQGERVLWEAGVSHRDRNSTLPSLEFEGTLFTIGVNFLLAR